MPPAKRQRLANAENVSPNVVAPAPAATAEGPAAMSGLLYATSTVTTAVICAYESLTLETMKT